MGTASYFSVPELHITRPSTLPSTLQKMRAFDKHLLTQLGAAPTRHTVGCTPITGFQVDATWACVNQFIPLYMHAAYSKMEDGLPDSPRPPQQPRKSQIWDTGRLRGQAAAVSSCVSLTFPRSSQRTNSHNSEINVICVGMDMAVTRCRDICTCLSSAPICRSILLFRAICLYLL